MKFKFILLWVFISTLIIFTSGRSPADTLLPSINPPRGDVRIMVISDLNSYYGATTYEPEVDQAIALTSYWQPDLVLCGGDMVAGQSPTLTEEQIIAMWQAFDRHVAQPLREAQIPFGFTIGNHDASSATGPQGAYLFGQERELASQYWQAPNHDPQLKFIDKYQFPFYYTFGLDEIFFLVWDGSSHLIPPQQLDWVKNSLGSQEAQQAKLRIVISHLPLYGISVGRDQPGEVMANADSLRQMLESYQVHTYISGHHHAYYPAHKGALQLLHAGILGSGPRPLIGGKFPPTKTITIVDVNFGTSELTTYTTYALETLQPIAYEELPPYLKSHNGTIWRRDVEQDKPVRS